MQTLNQSLSDLYLRKLITYDDAISKSQEPDELKRIIADPATVRLMRERAVRR